MAKDWQYSLARILFLSYLAAGSGPALAEINFLKMKGISELLKPEFQYLSPIYGFSLLKKGTLKNYYYQGNPKDQTVGLIRSMFGAPQGDESHFGVTTIAKNAAKHFGTQTVGVILNRI